MILLIYPSVHYLGIVGGQMACLAAILTGFVFQLSRVSRLTGLDLYQYAGAFLYPTAISGSIFVVCLAVRLLLMPPSPLPNLVIGTVGCLLAYGGVGLMSYRRRQIA